MNTTIKTLRLASCLVFLVCSLFAQGSLTPPGAPSATMKTLDEIHAAIATIEDNLSDVASDLAKIEARIDLATIDGSTLCHHNITASGSYYLSGNLAVTKTMGILISADDVTIDLNGFTIARSESSGGKGLYLNGGTSRTTIRDGGIRGFAYGVHYGTSPSIPEMTVCERLRVSGCTTAAIRVGNNSKTIRCQAQDNPGIAIHAENAALVEKCQMYACQGTRSISVGAGSVVRTCIINGNTCTHACIETDEKSVIERCSVYGNGIATYGILTANSCTISECVVSANEVNFGCYGGQAMRVHGCVVKDNMGVGAATCGILVNFDSRVSDCIVQGQWHLDPQSDPAVGRGIYASNGSVIRQCSVSDNGGDGICVASVSVVTDNLCEGNGIYGSGAGIHATGMNNRIQDNLAARNTRGVDIDNSGNMVVRNICTGNSINWDIAADNKLGPIVSAPDSSAISGDSGGTGMGSTDPWANFTY